MSGNFSFSQFYTHFPNDEICLEEIKKLRYLNGIYCSFCMKTTKHYKLKNRTAYACKYCRKQVYPLAGTIFEKTTTPLRVWFYCFFLMTQFRAEISIKTVQRECGVTYKTAWRMYKQTKMLMEQNEGNLLSGEQEKNSIRKWMFFNKLEFTVVEKKDEDPIIK